MSGRPNYSPAQQLPDTGGLCKPCIVRTAYRRLVTIGCFWRVTQPPGNDDKASCSRQHGLQSNRQDRNRRNHSAKFAAKCLCYQQEISFINIAGAVPPVAFDSAAGKESVQQLIAPRFTINQAKKALRQCNYDANLAAEWLFRNGDQVPDKEGM